MPLLLFFLFFLNVVLANAGTDSRLNYYEAKDYRATLKEWEKALREAPSNTTAVIRMSELKLLFEGRDASREGLIKFLEDPKSKLPKKDRELLHSELARLQSIFVSDHGQESFLKAIAKIQANDCAGAVALLEEAESVEKGNFKVLSEKAKCEMVLKQFERAYESLKRAYASNPYDSITIETLAEAHLYHGHEGEVLAMFAGEKGALSTLRQKLAYGYALYRKEDFKGATKVFQAVLKDAPTVQVHPIVYYTLGKIFLERSGKTREAEQYFNKFIASANNTPDNQWDPYRTTTYIAEAEEILKRMNQKQNG